MKKNILLVLCMLFSIICMAQKMNFLSEPIIQLENGKKTNIRDILDIDGYYESDSTDFYKMVFFEDGTYGPVAFKRGTIQRDIKANMSKWIWGTIKKQIDWGSYYYPEWGVYKIEGDTILCQRFTKGAALSPSYFWSERYRVIDRRSIKKIYTQSIRKDDVKYNKVNNISPWVDGSAVVFVPADSLPSSDCWLKEEKWIWRNEQDWKDYMEKIKQKEKKK